MTFDTCILCTYLYERKTESVFRPLGSEYPFREIERTTFRLSVCGSEPFRSCTIVPVSHFAHIYENKIQVPKMHIFAERKEKERERDRIKDDRLWRRLNKDPDRRLFTTRMETPVDGIRFSERNSSDEIGPTRRMTDSTIF